ncbi:hypothetical protein [Variovorax sp.]|uniref:hypothetical protein n=1 Tax=Variovorax sp. TaxID=1871043 RepID=UPI003BAB9B92
MRTRITTLTAASAACVMLLLAGCASRPGRDIDGDLALYIAEPVRQRFAGTPRAEPLATASALNFFENRQELELKGNLGLISVVRQQAHANWQQGQLLLVTGSDVAREKIGDNNARARFRGMSLCGLVPVFSEHAVGMQVNRTLVMPIGAVFIPVEVTDDVYFSYRYRMSRFEGDPAQLCAPAPGGSFTYRTETERQVKENGGRFARFNKQVTINDAVSCRAAPGVQPLSQITPGAKGSYLRVDCEHKDNIENLQRRSLAWLVDAGVYLPLEEVGWQGTIKTRYPRLGYTVAPAVVPAPSAPPTAPRTPTKPVATTVVLAASP